jgi:hypothetical protein
MLGVQSHSSVLLATLEPEEALGLLPDVDILSASVSIIAPLVNSPPPRLEQTQARL